MSARREARAVQPNLELLGRCPACVASIPDGNVVVEYRPTDGWPATIAECPDCGALVHPT